MVHPLFFAPHPKAGHNNAG